MRRSVSEVVTLRFGLKLGSAAESKPATCVVALSCRVRVAGSLT